MKKLTEAYKCDYYGRGYEEASDCNIHEQTCHLRPSTATVYTRELNKHNITIRKTHEE